MDNLLKDIYFAYLIHLDGGRLLHDEKKFRKYVYNYLHIIKYKMENQ